LRKCLKGSGGGGPSPSPSLSSIVYQATGCKAVHIPDKHMDLPTDSDMKRWLAYDQTDKEQYVAELKDCDDFARNVWNNIRNMAIKEGKNIAFAIIWTQAHALNLYVNNNRQVVFIEPQTDKRTSIHSVPRFVIF
jgi:hypothetical protein